MPSKDEQVMHDVKQPKPCLVMKNQWSMKWKNTQNTKQGRTSEARSQAMQTMPSDDEPVKQEVKQYKPCQVMMNQWSMKWDNTNHDK